MSVVSVMPITRKARVRAILHDEWCRSGWTCRGDNGHAVRAYQDIAATLLAAPDTAAVLDILHSRECPKVFARTIYPCGCDETQEHAHDIASREYVRRLLRTLS